MKKIKILMMPAFGIRGGIYQYVFQIIKYIDKNKFKIDILTRNEQLYYTKEYQELGFGIKIFSSKERENREQLVKEVQSILNEGYDVLHLHNACWLGFTIEEVAMRMGIRKVIIHSHSSSDIDVIDPTIRYDYLQRHNYYKQLFNKESATDFWACSWKAADWLFNETIPRDIIRIMPNAIEIDKYEYNESLRQTMRKKLGINNKYVIGHCGRFAYQKNHQFIVRVFKMVYSVNPDSVLLLIGDGELRESIESQIDELGLSGTVIFVGWVNNVNEYLQAFDVFILPSLFEGLPITLIEAQASGLHCIVNNNISEESNVVDDIQFLDLNEREWCKEIIRGMSLSNKRMSKKEFLRSKGFDITMQIKEVEKLYGEKYGKEK